jgi:hypothetical protein
MRGKSTYQPWCEAQLVKPFDINLVNGTLSVYQLKQICQDITIFAD